MCRKVLLCGLVLFLATFNTSAKSPVPPAPERNDDPLLMPWRKAAVHAVDVDGNRHSMHAYYLTSPESPDGRTVLCYTSTTANGQEGEIRILDRAGGGERVVARKLVTEDAHRVACQQWLSGGKRVAYHTRRGDDWLVAAVDLGTGREQVLAKDHLIGFGQPRANLVPIYGRHWKPGDFHDLEIVDVVTGKITCPVTAAAVRTKYPEWTERTVGNGEISIFFPVLSPDLTRVFFKMASPAGGDYDSTQASHREGIVSYDLGGGKFFFARTKWGHPAWSPDSQTILEVGNVLIDAATGETRRFAGAPPLGGEHPSFSPDGKLFVKDGPLDRLGGKKGEWGIIVGRLDGGSYVFVHRFQQSAGARSWRVSHPHPVFSPDGKRIYFNVSGPQWTRLHVAEAALSFGEKQGENTCTSSLPF